MLCLYSMLYIVIKSHRQVQIVSSLNGSAQLQSPSPQITSAKAGFCGSLMNPAVSDNEDGTLHGSYVNTVECLQLIAGLLM